MRSWIACALLAASSGVAHAQNQEAAPALPEELTVEGRRMPTAEAPRSATCEALARDPSFRALIAASGGNPYMGPRMFLPVRPPRNPDYSAPPKVAPGSPIPQMGRSRFGVASTQGLTTAADVAAVRDDNTSSDPSPFDMGGGDGYNLDDAVQSCRLAYTVGGAPPSAGGSSETSSGAGIEPVATISNDARVAATRAMIASRDTSLPTGFALFDQGRYAESLPYFRTAAGKLPDRDGGDEASLFVGKLYLFGLGAASDPAEGLKWIKKTATARFDPALEMPVFDPERPDMNTAVGEAAMILGDLYRTGTKGVTKDPAEARRWYERAFEVGHVAAAKLLGDIYFEGVDTPRDVAKAVTYYRKAAKLDHSGAQVALADILSEGQDGVTKNRKEALGWYQAAAKHNYAPATYELARAYELGDGVTADPARAIGLYKTAALGGSAPAQSALGAFFYQGKLVAKDDAVARQWFEQAAKGGDTDGMVSLAAMLARGEGGGRDRVRAWALLAVASRLGHPSAATMRTTLEKQMTPEERKAATPAR